MNNARAPIHFTQYISKLCFFFFITMSSIEATALVLEAGVKRCSSDAVTNHAACPWIDTEASVDDSTFAVALRLYLGSYEIISRWQGPNYFSERVYTWTEESPGLWRFLGPCVGNAVYFCYYPDNTWIWSESRKLGTNAGLNKSNVGTWTYEGLHDGYVFESKTFEVRALNLSALSGDNQIGLINTDLTEPLVLYMSSFDNIGVEDETFTWSISGPGGAKNTAVYGLGVGSETNSNGIEEATIHLGSKAGVYELTVDNDRILEAQTFTFTAIDDIEDTDPVIDHPDVEEGVGQGPQQCDNVGNPVALSLGNKFQRETDIGLVGLSPIEFVRYFNSLGYVSESFKNYWTHTYDRRIEVPAFPLVDTVKVIRPDGKKIGFSWNGNSYQPYSGVYSTLEKTLNGWQFVNTDSVVENFDDQGLLLNITELSGKTQTASHDSSGRLSLIESNMGGGLNFAYNADDQLSSIIDQSGRTWSYQYDVLTRLQFVDNADGTTREYHYEDLRHPYMLTGITGENTLRYSTYEYDEQGMAIASYHDGDVGRVDIQYNPNGDRVVLDPLGNSTTYQTRIENKRGVLEGISGPVCSQGCGLSDAQYSYDANLNITSQTAFGVTTSYGNYDLKGQVDYKILAVGTPEERRTDYEYDSRFIAHLTKITEPSVYSGGFKVTTRSYDSLGNLTSETVSGFDPFGQAVTRTSSNSYNGPFGQISSRDGHRTDISDITLYEYYPNLLSEGANRGQLKAIIDPNGVRIRDTIIYLRVPSSKGSSLGVW